MEIQHEHPIYPSEIQRLEAIKSALEQVLTILEDDAD